MIDEGELRRRYPEVPWDQPVLVTIPGLETTAVWVCRYCIAMNGLRAQDVLSGTVEFSYHSREDALAHIENTHHD